MRAIVGCCALWAILGAAVDRPQSPNDLTFQLRLKKNSVQYSTSEPIEFEISLSSTAEKKYYAAWTSLQPMVGVVEVQVEPQNGAVDLNKFSSGFVGSFLGSEGYLTAAPLTESADLTQWYRFEKTGHFRLSIAVDWVWRVDSHGKKQPVRLQSNAVEFEVLAPDAAMQSQELAEILDEIDRPGGDVSRQTALRRLDLMQGPPATQEKVKRFLAAGNNSWEYSTMLEHAANVDEAIPELRAALRNPAFNPVEGLVGLLADLEVRKERGDPKPWPKSEEAQNAARDDANARTQLRGKLARQYGDELASSLRLRSGPQRLGALYNAWAVLDVPQHRTPDESPAVENLREQVLSAAKELSSAQQVYILNNLHDVVPHGELLSIALGLANAAGTSGWEREEAFTFWCEYWPSDCGKSLASAVLRKDKGLTYQMVLLAPEAEHAELDEELRGRMTDEKTLRDPQGSSLTGAAMLRMGSKSLEATAIEGLQLGTNQSCEYRGELLGYLLRVDSKEGSRQLQSVLEPHSQTGCGQEVLQGLSQAKSLGAAMPVLTAELNNPDLCTAGAAAILLGDKGPDSARPALVERLRVLREQWKDQAAEISSPGPILDPAGKGLAVLQATQFEQQLVSALAHAKSWKLSDDELQSLRNGCMTEQCTQMTQGAEIHM